MKKQGYVYILASEKNGTLYTGVTSDLCHRVREHKNKENKGFTEKYNINKLIYFEVYESMYESIVREKRIKKWERKWKLKLIEKENPEWKDLYHEICNFD